MNPKPTCIIITGRPGSGKTTLSKKLSDLLHMPMLSRDKLKEGLVNTLGIGHNKLPEETNRNVTEFFFSATQMFLKANISVVIEAAFQQKIWIEVVPHWSKLSQLQFVICVADPMLCEKRHLDRGLKDPSREYYHGDESVKIFRETGKISAPKPYLPPLFNFPTIRVDTTDGYAPNLAEIEKFILTGTTK